MTSTIILGNCWKLRQRGLNKTIRCFIVLVVLHFLLIDVYRGVETTTIIEANRHREPRLPHVFIEDQTVEPSIPSGRPDIVVDPLNYENEVRNEDFRYHRLPSGVLEGTGDLMNSASTVEAQNNVASISRVINHGDQNVEALLFPTLYPYGRGQWQYHKVRSNT